MNRSPATWQNGQVDDRQSAEQLSEVFARWQDELLGMLYYLMGNREDARDALQEAFMKCWRRRSRLGQVENLRAWVFRVTLNAGRDARATAWRRKRQPLGEAQADLPSREAAPGARLDRQEELALVRRALVELRSEEQKVFLLRQNGQMTYDEIAQTLAIPPGTVKTRMRLALRKLREALEGRHRSDVVG